MHLETVKTQDIIVFIFFDLNGLITPPIEDQWRYKLLVQAVKTAFETKCLPTLSKQRSHTSTNSMV
jgi:hypothetical protein